MKTIALREVADIFRTPMKASQGDRHEACLIRQSNIQHHRIVLDDCQSVPLESDRHRLRTSDILLVNDASKVGIFPDYKGEDIFQASNGLVTIRVTALEIVHPALLFAYLNLKRIKHHVEAHCCRGSSMQYIEMEALRKLQIPLLDDPSRAECIAHTIQQIHKINALRRQQEALMIELMESIVHRELVEGIPAVKKGGGIKNIITGNEAPEDYCI